jgi:hypothetical protein
MTREESFIRIYCELTGLPESSARCAFMVHDAMTSSAGHSTGGGMRRESPPDHRATLRAASPVDGHRETGTDRAAPVDSVYLIARATA